MLRTNSKKAIENIRAYIVKGFDGTNYEPKFDYIEKAIEDNKHGSNIDIFSLVANAIYSTFVDEYMHEYNRRRNEQTVFVEWCACLPSIIDTCYYYNRSAVADLGDILEQTEEERNRYTEEEAEVTLSRLIYREITRGTRK